MDLVSAVYFDASSAPNIAGRRASRNRQRAGHSPAVQRIPDHRAVNKRPGQVREQDEPRRNRRSRRSRRWGQTTEVGPNIRIQTRNGRRAALVPIRDGLWILGDLDEATLEQMQQQATAEIGFAPMLMLAPLLIQATMKGLAPEIARAQAGNPIPAGMPGAQGATFQRLLNSLVPKLLAPSELAVPVAEIGCGGSRCHCGE